MPHGNQERPAPKEQAQATPIVDMSLVEECLRMTPEERLALNDRMVRTILELKRGFDKQQAG